MEDLSEKLKNEPAEVLERLKFIGRVARELDYPVYIVGGFVRDIILGVDDFDLDVVVEGDGINFAKELAFRLGADFIKHKRFGTATVVTKDKIKVDVASARKEIYEEPASLPKVSPGTIKDDLGRRDFAINAMAIDIAQSSFGRLVDFYQSREDIEKKAIRILHNLSFIDDPTRILRAIRFEQRFNFRIESRTLKLLQEALSRGMLEKVHKHRLRDEIILILKEPCVVKCLSRINELCGLKFIHSDLRLDNKTLNLLGSIDEAHSWFRNSFTHRRKLERWLLYLMVLLEGLDRHSLEAALKEFAFRKGEAKIILSFKSESAKAISRLKESVSPSHIYRILEPLSYEVILLTLLKADSREVKNKIKDFLRMYSASRIFISGHELKELGITPGPDFKEILKKLLYAKLDKKFKTREEELRYLKNKILTKSDYC